MRTIHTGEIDRLTGTAKLNIYKRDWVRVNFLKNLAPNTRLALDEWLYLASASGCSKLWAHDKYNQRETISWHRHGTKPIELELKNEQSQTPTPTNRV